MLNNRYLIGSDPELFVFNTKTKRVASAIGIIPGQKEEPYTTDLPKGYGLQTDNVLAEFNIPPASTLRSFISSINYMKDVIRTKVKEYDEQLDILCTASAKVPVKELAHPQARLFGCSPDYCVYTERMNEPAKPGRSTLRSAGDR